MANNPALGGEQPASKASARRLRVSVFGGNNKSTTGRRTIAGKKFNSRAKQAGPTGPAGPQYTGFNGVSLGLNEGVVPEGNLYQTWRPVTDLSGNQVPWQDPSGRYVQVGSLETGAYGYYEPTTGRWTGYNIDSQYDGGDNTD